jgi:two-component system response regulator HydG
VRDVLTRVTKIAPTDAIVLITGESGTGKELIARAVHANSKRANRPFVTVNCAAITETLLESELFGHARGAFTGASHARAETTLAFQAKLLRALQEGEIRRIGENRPIKVDLRVVAATNIDLASAVEERRFRQDLYYRLNVARFHLPPLRNRREDVPLLFEFFLDKYTRKMNKRAQLAEGVMDQLVAYDYPGNVRELENMVEQAVALASGGVITTDDILPQAPKKPARASGQTLADIVDEAEREAVLSALRSSDGSRERAAVALDISPTRRRSGAR